LETPEERPLTAHFVDGRKVFIRGFLTHAEYSKDKWKNDPWYKSAPFLQ
jgi:hypothetical protein